MLDFGFYNIDCMEGMKDIPNDTIDLTLTDIPYEEVNSNRTGGNIRQIKKGDADVNTFHLHDFLNEVWRITKGTIIIFCGIGQVSEIYSYFRETTGTVRQLIWEKSNPSPMNGDKIYLSGIENAIWIKKPKATFNAFCENTVFRYPVGGGDIHPTEKNHRLISRLIGDNSNVGDIVFDPCAGSASTLLMARKLGRKYIGFELNPNYYEKAKNRLDQETAQMTIFDMGFNPYQE